MTSEPSVDKQKDIEVPVVHVYRWDLDKTYLQTEFDSVRDLIRTAMQKPEDKATVPGAIALLREIKRPSDVERSLVTFISGSPTQMRRVLEKKFEIDGIRPDAFVLKPTLENILKGRFKAVRGQVGYKLEALLRIRSEGSYERIPETLFGDDAEQDAFIYSVYADLISGQLGLDVLRDVLVEAEVYATTMEKIMRFAAHLQPVGSVDRIFINLDRRSPPGRFLTLGPRIVPIVNYFQAALVLYADGTFTMPSLIRVAGGMLAQDDYGLMELANSFQDLLRRRILTTDDLERLESDLRTAEVPDVVPKGFAEKPVGRVRALAPRPEVNAREWQGPPNYIEILRSDRAMKEAVTQKKTGLFG